MPTYSNYTNTQIRNAWEPHCTGPFARMTFFGGAVVSVRPAVVDAFKALNVCFITHNYPVTPPDCGCYNCRKTTGSTTWSFHSYAIAGDWNWQDNPYGRKLKTNMPMAMILDIERIRTRNGKIVLRWGGRYSGNKDAMHIETVCLPRDLATGIDPATVPGGIFAPPAKSKFPAFPGKLEEGMTSDGVLILKFVLTVMGFGHFSMVPAVQKVYTAGVTNEVKRLIKFHNELVKTPQWKGDGTKVGPEMWKFLNWMQRNHLSGEPR